MRLFPCAACAAKDETIAFLKEQLAAADRRNTTAAASVDKALESAVALADRNAHAVTYRKPGAVRAPHEQTLKSPFDLMAETLPAVVPGQKILKTQEELEEMYDAAAGRIPVVGEQPAKPTDS
jgi:hypothetical protein